MQILKEKTYGKIGLEIHVYLNTIEKLFCKCIAVREKGAVPNSSICPICTGQPGAKPMLPNGSAVAKAVQIGLILGCKINSPIFWQRKHYDWPDMPKGYQNTISGGHAVQLGTEGKYSGIGITGMHLEEDPAAWDPLTGQVDYNRSGLPLVEIVTDPDFKDSESVVEWLGKLVHVLVYLKAVDKMAGIKVDVNVSLVDENGEQKTERVEVKNIHSFDSIKNAINYEVERQAQEGSVRETRRYDEVRGKTMHMRKKEKADDYRFITDPDLVAINLDEKFVLDLKKKLPETPDVKLGKMIKKYKIGEKDAGVLTKHLDIADFYENVSAKIDGKFALPWVTIELLRVLNWNKKSLDELEIKVEHFVKLLELVENGKITELQAKQILNKFVPKSFDPSKTEGKIEDKKELKKIAEEVIKKNKKAVQDYKNGDTNALNYLMGEIMKATDRRADFKTAKEVLTDILR